MSVPHGKWRIETQAVHSGEEEKFGGAAVTPIFQSSTYVFDGDTSRGYDAVKYVRCNNSPSHTVSRLLVNQLLHSTFRYPDSIHAGGFSCGTHLSCMPQHMTDLQPLQHMRLTYAIC